MTARQPQPDEPATPPRGWGGVPTPPAGGPTPPGPSPDGPTSSSPGESPGPTASSPGESPGPRRTRRPSGRPSGRPTPPRGFTEVPTRPQFEGAATAPARADRRARRRAGLAAVPTGAFPAADATGGVPTTGLGRHRPSWLHRLVGAARVLTGGMIVLALVVAIVPLVLGTAGAGTDAVVGHIAGALAALAATGVAAHRRVPTGPALAAAGAVPVIVLVVLAVYWWS